MGDLLAFYWDLPPVTRAYLTGATALTVACSMDIVSPFQLYFNARQVARGELWRLVTNFLFFGPLGVDFLFHMFFVIRYCRSLEEGSFSQRSADFAWCLLFGMAALLALSPWFNMMFFASRCVITSIDCGSSCWTASSFILSCSLAFSFCSLTFMLVYLWAKRNPQLQISLLGLLAFNAPYLPWVLLAFSGLLGHDILSDALGITVGHFYYYFEDVWPALAEARGWRRLKRPLGTPIILHWIFRTPAHARNRDGARLAEFEIPAAVAAAGAPAEELGPQELPPEGEAAAAGAEAQPIPADTRAGHDGGAAEIAAASVATEAGAGVQHRGSPTRENEGGEGDDQ
jgi:Derlin-2/3